MSNRALTWAWSVRGITSTQKLVLIRLADAANADNEVWHSAQVIAADTGLKDRAVRYALDALEAGHLIAGERATGKAARWTLNLDVIVPTLTNGGGQPRHQMPRPTPARDAVVRHGRSTPKPRHHMPEGSAPDAGPPRHHVPTEPKLTQKNPKEEIRGGADPRARAHAYTREEPPPQEPPAERLPNDWKPDEAGRAFALDRGLDPDAVSYTHLTLPTILRV